MFETDHLCLTQPPIMDPRVFASEKAMRKLLKRARQRSFFVCEIFAFPLNCVYQSARITNWFSRQNGSSSQRRSHGDLDSSVKTFDAFVQTDDDASRAVIAGAALICSPFLTLTRVPAFKKAADDAEIARKLAEESGARLLQASVTCAYDSMLSFICFLR
jgi:hypothetical protein